MFEEAWRLLRDNYYDPHFHGADWSAMREKYRPWALSAASAEDFRDVVRLMMGEVNSSHMQIYGPPGDGRNARTGVLGALFDSGHEGPGLRVLRVVKNTAADRSESRLAPGDVILAVNGLPVGRDGNIYNPLEGTLDRKTRLTVRRAAGGDEDVVIRPMSARSLRDRIYEEQIESRRQFVEEAGRGQVAYTHLAVMGVEDLETFERDLYAVAQGKKALIVDVRNNRGGNIDSWILGRLLRKAWFGWSQHSGQAPAWNMQYAFRGHVVVLCNERTASDGEAFAEGIRRLGIGTVIGTRTWGGEIWLSSSNFLVDRGIATAAEFGVYGPDGTWLIEGHGVEPDIVVDNLPHATFGGADTQLDAAIEFLNKKIVSEPIPDLARPTHPDKSFDYPER